MKRHPMPPLLAALVACFIAVLAGAHGAEAQTRRAFLVGIERYGDGNIQRLSRSVADAKGLSGDLEQFGFDPKNVTVATDLRTKAEFNKKFDAFLKTIQEGDIVLFFFSGHGLGIDSAGDNYLLLGDLKSLLTFTRGKEKDVKNPDILKLRMPANVEAYESEEIPRAGMSVREIQQRIAEKKPRVTLMLLDACRSLASPDPAETRRIVRGAESGSRLVPSKDLPPGFLVLYSASYGESAVESLGFDDRGRNSLFTSVLRAEMVRPGQTLTDLSARVRLAVRSIADKSGFQQEPDYYQNLGDAADFALIDSIGAERFQMSDDRCDGSASDWDQIMIQPRRELIERHLRRYGDCATAEKARRTLANFADSTEEAIARAPAVPERSDIDECDRLAASDSDPKRPVGVLGVPLSKIDPEPTRAACELAIKRNPNVVRFRYNLGRAELALANELRSDDPAQKAAFVRARLTLEEAAERGYVPALNNLAILYDNGYGVERNPGTASNLLRRAAQQGLPIAMYNLGLRYKFGTTGVDRDIFQAYEWFAKAAESEFVPAMVEAGDALRIGSGVAWNPRRAAENYQRAAEAGSLQAMTALGTLYFFGNSRQKYGTGALDPKSVPADDSRALLWIGRAADAGDSDAQFSLAFMMRHGFGLPNPQPEIAERYYRLAAYSGYADAEFEFADMLRTGKVLIKPENGEDEGIKLLERALSQGTARAAWQLAQIYRSGQFGQEKDPLKAMKYAFQTIKLSTLADPTSLDGNSYYEYSAGILLSEMAANGEAVDDSGRPLLTKDEIDRIETFYGKADPATKQVKVRRLSVPLRSNGANCRSRQNIWVWDWGRLESPTEPQFRSLERTTNCKDNKDLRDTLSASFSTARKNDVPFADLIEQQIKSAVTAAETQSSRKRQN